MAEQPPDQTWTTCELPILRAALARADAGEIYVDLRELQAELDMEAQQMYVALRALSDADYIEVAFQGRSNTTYVSGHISQVREKARRELGSWPSADSIVDQLVAALDSAADQEPESVRKGKLRNAADLLGGMARDIAVATIAARLG